MSTGSGPGRFAGRIALVTGASRGIGRAVALALAREGADLILVSRTQGALEELDDEIRALGRHAALVPGDLGDGGMIDQMAAATFQRWGRLDVLIGNAGELGILSPVSDIDPAVWEQTFAINLTANFRLLRAFDPLLRAARAGRAVFITSSASAGRAYWSPYAASKAALECLVRCYAEEVARVSPVRANLVNPRARRTRMRAAAFPTEDPAQVKPADDPALLLAILGLAAADCTATGTTVRVD
jgi:NAD(P)-dependent dehydrogenase (short-subunit alcohol dehydrogenase family)